MRAERVVARRSRAALFGAALADCAARGTDAARRRRARGPGDETHVRAVIRTKRAPRLPRLRSWRAPAGGGAENPNEGVGDSAPPPAPPPGRDGKPAKIARAP